MITSLNPSSQEFLNNLNNISDRMAEAERQISTGLKISRISDAPDSVSLLLQARANLGGTQQRLSNLGRFKTEVDAAEQAVQNAVTIFDNVQTLGAQGSSDILTASGRADVAQQLDGLLQQTVGLAGTSVEGRFVFAGDTDQQVPYTYTAGQTNPVSAYLGSASTRLVEHPNGTTFAIALDAHQIFDSTDPTTNVFAAIANLSAALKANDNPAIQSANDALAKVGDYLNSQLAFYGTAQNKVASASDFGQTLQLQLQTQIGNLQDADLSQAILALNQAGTQQQAALQAHARLPRTSLFDFLG